MTADHYIVSADGVTHGLPNLACLEMLLDSRPLGDEYEILLTNPMPPIQEALETPAAVDRSGSPCDGRESAA